MKIELYDKGGVLLDNIDLGRMSVKEAYEVMDQVREIVRKQG